MQGRRGKAVAAAEGGSNQPLHLDEPIADAEPESTAAPPDPSAPLIPAPPPLFSLPTYACSLFCHCYSPNSVYLLTLRGAG